MKPTPIPNDVHEMTRAATNIGEALKKICPDAGEGGGLLLMFWNGKNHVALYSTEQGPPQSARRLTDVAQMLVDTAKPAAEA